MSAPAPPPANSGYQRPAPRLAVLLGQPGAAPTLEDEVDYLIPYSVERFAGGGRIDTMVLEYDLAKRGERLVDVTAPIGYDREVEVVELDEDGEIIRTLAWGKIGVQPIRISGGGSGDESIRLKVRMDHHLFGEKLVKTPFWDQKSGEIVRLDHDWIFNPEIDERIEPNRSSHQEEEDRDEAYLFVDPESLRTGGAEAYQGQQAYLWKLHEAVHRLVWEANQDETYITNPTLSEIEGDLQGVQEDLFKNHKLKAGQYLPKALDDLLEPYGCDWFIAYEIDETTPESPERIRKLRFFRDAAGTERKIYLQRPDERLEVPKSNVEEVTIDFSIVDLANEIEGRSSFKEVETTFFIFPLWDPADDSLDIEDLKVGTETYKDHPHVGRKFGINTDGTYDGLRPEIPDVSDILTELKSFLGEDCIARRHILKPCLSRVTNSEGEFESRGVYVEWRNPENVEEGDPDSGWEQVDSAIHVSGKEAAVFVGSDTPHEGIWSVIQEDPATLEMRVTATWTSDMRHHETAVKQATSPNGDVISLFLDLSDKFHHRTVDSESIFDGDGTADTWTNAEDDMLDYLEHLRSIDDAAEVAVSARLEGLDNTEYEIGQLITEVEGRNLKFDANAPSSGTPRRLQIVAIILDLQAQKTTLELESIQESK